MATAIGHRSEKQCEPGVEDNGIKSRPIYIQQWKGKKNSKQTYCNIIY